MRVALVHDWLVTYAGAERILEQLVKIYPDADIFSLVDFLPPERRHFIAEKPIKTSFIQKPALREEALSSLFRAIPARDPELRLFGL